MKDTAGLGTSQGYEDIPVYTRHINCNLNYVSRLSGHKGKSGKEIRSM